LVLTGAPLHAEAPVTFKVGAAPAEVHKAPTTASPVVGHAARGAVLDVTRELGSWVKIEWPAAQEGVGYVHVSTGTLARAGSTREPKAAAAPTRSGGAQGPPIPPPPPSAASRAERTESAPPPRPSAGYVRAPEHVFGVGGRVGAPDFDLGVAARLWSRSHFALQAQLSRASDDLDRRSTVEFAPSVLYAARDHVDESWWLRPYLGGGPTFVHRTAADGVLPIESIGQGTFGLQGFGGVEVTLPSLPRFAFSADLGYRWLDTAPIGSQHSGVVC